MTNLRLGTPDYTGSLFQVSQTSPNAHLSPHSPNSLGSQSTKSCLRNRGLTNVLLAKKLLRKTLRAQLWEVCSLQINLLHLPQQLSQLEARKTDCDNVNAKQPTCVQTGGRKASSPLDQTSAIFSLHNRTASRGPYISYGGNLRTCLNRPEMGLIIAVLNLCQTEHKNLCPA